MIISDLFTDFQTGYQVNTIYVLSICFYDIVQCLIQTFFHIKVSIIILEFMYDQMNQGMLEYIAFVLGQNFLDGIVCPCLTRFLST